MTEFGWWKLVYWIFATGGIAGLIALAVFYPLALIGIWNAVKKLFGFVLSYRIGCAIVAAILAAFIADYWRHDIEDERHAAEVAAFEQAQDDRDKRIRKETRDEVLIEIANAAAESAVTDKDVKEFTDALPPIAPTGNPFRVGADACRLRHIAGQAECGPHGVKRVPKADTSNEGVGHRRALGLSSVVRRSLGRDEQGK